MSTILETSLVRTPDVCGGRLRIDGTRLTVNQIITLYNQGATPKEIVVQYPDRSLNEIFAAIAWYLDNKLDFDNELARESQEEEDLRQGLDKPPAR